MFDKKKFQLKNICKENLHEIFQFLLQKKKKKKKRQNIDIFLYRVSLLTETSIKLVNEYHMKQSIRIKFLYGFWE